MVDKPKPTLSEAEIQVLIVSIELSEPVTTPNNNHYAFFPKTAEEAGLYFRGLRVDWGPAYVSLQQKGFLTGDHNLTAEGRSKATQIRRDRPPIYYWYEEANRLTAFSPAYDNFCRQLYGKAQCQYNFSDTAQLDDLLAVLTITSENKVLDLGCSKGYITEYFSDLTGANCTGIDYSEEAIRQANLRTHAKRQRLHFEHQNMDALDFPDASFDIAVSIDTLYMPNDLVSTLQKIIRILKPGGQLGVFYSAMIDPESANRDDLLPNGTPLGIAFRELGVNFSTTDYSEQNYHHLQRKHQLGLAMKANFEAENHLALWHYIMAESESSSQPYQPATCNITRFLYHARMP